MRLVDKIGGLDEAIASAAALAELEKYDVVEMRDKATPFERLLKNIASDAIVLAGLERQFAGNSSALGKIAGAAKAQVEFFDQFNDPNAAYARCLECE